MVVSRCFDRFLASCLSIQFNSGTFQLRDKHEEDLLVRCYNPRKSAKTYH